MKNDFICFCVFGVFYGFFPVNIVKVRRAVPPPVLLVQIKYGTGILIIPVPKGGEV
jgi:hypothetical protein